MIEILNSYLIQHKSLSIPGLGTVYLEKIPAISDFANRRILPPSFKFRFDKYFDAPDKEFFSYLAANSNVQEYEAIKQYNEFAYELRNSIRKDDQFIWPQVGVLMRDHNGEILFRSETIQPEFLKPVPANRVMRHDTKHAILVGERERTAEDMAQMLGEEVHVEKESWWTYALIIFAVALILLFFRFYQHGWKFLP